MLKLSVLINQMNQTDMYILYSDKKNRLSPQKLMELSSKLITYLGTKQVSTDTRKLKEHPAPYLVTMGYS